MKKVEVLGISTDTVEDNAVFAARYGFPFPLLCDTEREVCAAYGTCDPEGQEGPQRVTFVVGSEGKILQVHRDFEVEEHAARLLGSDLACEAAAPRRVAAEHGAGARAANVYAVGHLGYGFASAVRREFFRQRGVADPQDAAAMLVHLDSSPWDVTALCWTLEQDRTSIYAVLPGADFGEQAHRLFRRLLRHQLRGEVERVILAGWVEGEITLEDGRRLPLVRPELRGLREVSPSALVEEMPEPRPEERGPSAGGEPRIAPADFLERLFDATRQPGRQPRQRALNAALTDIPLLAAVFRRALRDRLELDRIAVRRVAFRRPDQESWAVDLIFFDPRRRLEVARRVTRLVIDVSDVVPARVGKLRHWFEY